MGILSLPKEIPEEKIPACFRCYALTGPFRACCAPYCPEKVRPGYFLSGSPGAGRSRPAPRIAIKILHFLKFPPFREKISKKLLTNLVLTAIISKRCLNSIIQLHLFDPLAQPAEHLTFNQGVRSSNLRWIIFYGGVAHLGERLNGIQEVVGSIPIVSI